MSGQSWNPWKLTAVGMALMIVTALITGVVVANRYGTDADKTAAEAKAAANEKAAVVAPSPARPATARKEAPRHANVAQVTPAATPSVAQTSPTPNVAQATPGPAPIEECNRYAAEHTASRDKTMDTAKNAGVGALLGAAVGAAGGAIADGGKGAGKGAAIGGLIGAGGGTVYGLNENKKHDEAYRAAYASCMRSRGFSG